MDFNIIKENFKNRKVENIIDNVKVINSCDKCHLKCVKINRRVSVINSKLHNLFMEIYKLNEEIKENVED